MITISVLEPMSCIELQTHTGNFNHVTKSACIRKDLPVAIHISSNELIIGGDEGRTRLAMRYIDQFAPRQVVERRDIRELADFLDSTTWPIDVAMHIFERLPSG